MLKDKIKCLIGNKDISIPLDKFFQLINPEYIYLKIQPHKSTRNHDTSNMAKTIQSLYKSLNKRIKIEQKKLWFETNFKISYIVDITKENTDFYFIVPKIYKYILIDKIYEVWPKVEVTEVNGINEYSKDVSYYQLNYKKEDALSLKVDKKTNEPLNSILTVMQIMHEEDRFTIVCNFLPKNQFSWQQRYDDTIKKVENLKPIEKDKHTLEFVFKTCMSILLNLMTTVVSILNDFAGGGEKQATVFDELLITSNILDARSRINNKDNPTSVKRNKTVLDTQILLLSDSEISERRKNNMKMVSQAYSLIDGDNELVCKNIKIDKKINFTDRIFKNVGINTFSVDECQNFIQQPGRTLMRTLGIKHIEVSEVKIPKEFLKGCISLGTVKFQNEENEAFIQDEYNNESLPLVVIGAQGSGKSKFMTNIYKCTNKRKQGGVVIDYIKNCEMSQDIIDILPSEDCLILDYTKEEDLQAFAFNEYKRTNNMTAFEETEVINLQAEQLVLLIDMLNPEQHLQARMRKYLTAACNVVVAGGGNSLKDVVKCLSNYIERNIYINNIDKKLYKYFDTFISDLRELDEVEPVFEHPEEKGAKRGRVVEEIPIGTKESKIDGILDRISLLKSNVFTRTMFEKDSNENINFVDALEKGKTIIIRMPQNRYTKLSTDIIVTFLLTKVWLSAKIRGSLHEKPLRCNISVDEIFQCPTAMNMLKKDEIMPQTRKYGYKFIFSSQKTEQLSPIISSLESAGASFMLLRGCTEDDYNKFKSKITDFEYEDLRDMKKWHSLNIIYGTDKYISFISHLPTPDKI